jgi:hypothetical protein
VRGRCAPRRDKRDTVPPPNPDALRVTRAVMQKHRAELTHVTGEHGVTTAVIRIPS